MNYLKNVFIATILLNLAMIFASEYTAYTQETPANSEEVNVTEATPATEETIQEIAQPLTDSEKWNNHLTALAENDDYWDSTSNIPTNSWKETAITLAKSLLDKDKTVAETLKTEFLNTVSTAIQQKNGTFSSAYNFIQEFNNTIDAYVKTITEAEIKEEPKPVEEVKQEPVTEPAPAEVEAAPTPPKEEEKISQPETSTSSSETPRDFVQEWNNIIENIKTTGTTLKETQDLLHKAYELAREILSQKSLSLDFSVESLQYDLESALNYRKKNPQLFIIDNDLAIAAFNEAIGYDTSDKQTQELQKKYTQAMKKREKEEEARRKELKDAATMQKAIQQANISQSDMQKLNERLQNKLAQDEAERAQEQAKTEREIQKIKEELARLRKIKREKAEEEPGILESISQWWYGKPEEITREDLNTRRLKTIKESSTFKNLPAYKQEKIIADWNRVIESLKSAPSFEGEKEAYETWLKTIKKFLKELAITYHIISIQEARDIIEDNMEPSSYRIQINKEVKKYLEGKQRKIIEKKEQEEFARMQKLQQREEKKELILRKQQQVKNEQNRIKNEQNQIEAKQQKQLSLEQKWENILVQLRKDSTEEKNHKKTKKAIEIARSLMLLIPSPEKRKKVEQKLKNEFTAALVAQPQVNKHEINIQQDLTTFYNELHKITETIH